MAGDLSAPVTLAPSVPTRVARATARKVDDLISEGGAQFRSLVVSHASSTAGDTLVAIALAGTLFFSVPSSEARDKVALYLLITVAPFAVIGPLLGALLDRWHSMHRTTLLASSVIRAVLAIALGLATSDWALYSCAFGLLIMSRTHGISRQAMLPASIDGSMALVAANARIAQMGVLAGGIVVPFGVLAARLGGAFPPLILASVCFTWSTIAGLRVPSVGFRTPDEPTTREDRRERAAERATARAIARSERLPRTVRIAQIATAMVRLLNGFLVLLLAFAFREQGAGAFDFGAVLAAAGIGFGLASVMAPRLERRLREEPMVLAAMAVEAGAAFIAGQWFGLAAAATLALAAGLSWGTAKFAFDGLLQAAVPPERRGRAFTRSETMFQLAWVLGAILPTAIAIPTDIGLVLAGLAALVGQVVYVAHLLMPLRDALGYEPEGDNREPPFPPPPPPPLAPPS